MELRLVQIQIGPCFLFPQKLLSFDSKCAVVPLIEERLKNEIVAELNEKHAIARASSFTALDSSNLVSRKTSNNQDSTDILGQNRNRTRTGKRIFLL